MNAKIEGMFSIFQKKTYLIDLFQNFTDFHNHILPGIDDGAQTVSDSLGIINEFHQIGINDFVCTPHVMGDYYPNTPQTILEALEKVNNSSDFNLRASAEYMLDQNFIDILNEKKILPLVENNILIEMSYFQPPINLNELLFKVQNHSYSPILAHPERYAYLHSAGIEKYKSLKDRGCSFQLNMLSLTGHYGGNIQKMAYTLLEHKLIDFISSDAHKVEHVEKIKGITIKKKHLPILEDVINNSKNLFD